MHKLFCECGLYLTPVIALLVYNVNFCNFMKKGTIFANRSLDHYFLRIGYVHKQREFSSCKWGSEITLVLLWINNVQYRYHFHPYCAKIVKYLMTLLGPVFPLERNKFHFWSMFTQSWLNTTLPIDSFSLQLFHTLITLTKQQDRCSLKILAASLSI